MTFCNNFSCFDRSYLFLTSCWHHDRLGLAGVWIALVHRLSHDRLLLHRHLTSIRVVRIHLDRLGHHGLLLLLLHIVGVIRVNIHHLLLRWCIVSRCDDDILGIVCIRVLTSGDHCLSVHFVMLLSLKGLLALNSSDHAYDRDDNTYAAGNGKEDVKEDYGSDSLSFVIIIVVVAVVI